LRGRGATDAGHVSVCLSCCWDSMPAVERNGAHPEQHGRF